MAHPSILVKGRTALVVVDVQEAFRGLISDLEDVAGRIAIAVAGFHILGSPVIVTEQYPKGLGPTVAEIKSVLNDDDPIFEKTAFSSCGAAPFVEKLEELGVNQVLLCGLETHICVSQTAHDLLDRGYQVHVLVGSVCSRVPYNRRVGLRKMFSSGVIAASIEMALFELMGDSKHESFKEIQALIK
ncbi:MAG: isochorismatase family protein [Acidobacteria bacterium]|nr:isochorismatase family protein [Acidobacteriota bacterium]